LYKFLTNIRITLSFSAFTKITNKTDKYV
jgi:hypothetical protein